LGFIAFQVRFARYHASAIKIAWNVRSWAHATTLFGYAVKKPLSHSLNGTEAVRLAYIDEAGISNPKQEPILVVCGVLIHADKNLIEIERHFERLVGRYIPPEFQKDFVFHATELFNGGGKVFDRKDERFPLNKRLEIAEQIAAIPQKFNLRLAFGFVDRAKFSESGVVKSSKLLNHVEQSVAAHLTAFMVATLQVDRWMRKNAPNEVCMLVVEDNQQARRFISDTVRHHQNRDVLEFADPDISKFFPFRKIKEEPLFQAKRARSPLQLADFFAYVFKRHMMGDVRYSRLLRIAWNCVAAHEYDRPEEILRQSTRSLQHQEE